jgi:hypothetical protein
MIAQIRAELLKIRTTRTTIGLILGMIALILLFTLLTGCSPTQAGLPARGPASAAEREQFHRRVLRTCWGVACDQRVPLRHDPSDDLVQPRALTRPGRQGRRRRAGRTRIRDPRRGDRLGDRLRDPRRAWHHVVLSSGDILLLTLAGSPAWPCGARSAPASARSSTTKSAQSSRCSPGGSSSTTSCSASSLRSGGSRQPALGRTHGPPSPSSPLARRRRDHVDRLGRRTRRSSVSPYPFGRTSTDSLGDRWTTLAMGPSCEDCPGGLLYAGSGGSPRWGRRGLDTLAKREALSAPLLAAEP